MFDWLSSGKKPNEQGNQEYFGSLTALHQHVSNAVSTVKEIANSLNPKYSEEGLSNISQRFEGISKEYTDFTVIQSNSFYEVLNRSKSRLNAAKKVAKEAKNIAKLFEKYARRPISYSAVDSRLAINKLAGELRNLAMYCTPEVAND